MSIKKTILAAGCMALFAAGCKDDAVPKPKAFLSMKYPTGTYKEYNPDCPYRFAYNSLAKVEGEGNCNFDVKYAKMKATIYLTYKKVTKTNLDSLLRDAQKLTYEHVIKADEIDEQPFINRDNKVYGMFYEVQGNAATNAQFYVTDSVSHFITGSMYFYARPNFDSILPAANYVKNDMRNLMETLRWK